MFTPCAGVGQGIGSAVVNAWTRSGNQVTVGKPLRGGEAGEEGGREEKTPW